MVISVLLSACSNEAGSGTIKKAEIKMDDKTQKCVSCHEKEGNGISIVHQWQSSTHAAKGIGCLQCHEAGVEDLDGFDHEGEHIATIVTPKDCAKCHPKESEEFQKSHHADAGAIMGSLDNVLAEVVEGHESYDGGKNPAAANGCWQCHGSRVELLKDSAGNVVKNAAGIIQYDPKTWPNTGMGRINLDGSKGSCSACHVRHIFDLEQARSPENCGKCHMGPDHPQIEIYNESKHGIVYRAKRDEMNLSSKSWVVGQDYSVAPTCATCHMSATPNQKVSHEVGARISWTLRPAISEKIDESMKKKYEKLGQELPDNFLSWEQRRENMVDVCKQCHTPQFVANFYIQFDSEVNMYNDKFAKPGMKLIKLMREKNLLTPIDFDEKVEWTWFFLWHHEGRRARHGASMMAPDYTQWHGNFEVADRWYTQMVPEIREIIEHAKKTGKSAEAKEVETLLDEILNSEMHKWFVGKMSPEEIEKRKENASKYRERYTNSEK